MDLLGKLLQDLRGRRARTSKEGRSRDTTLQYTEVSNDLNCVRKFDFLESLFVDFNSIHFAKKREGEDRKKSSQRPKKR
ncbi:hypothetical protein P5673_022010 [Acropora cervicornis]|uniref:Uncharacterized protein n=1 Tax=Acropora cervicornis TaxID=6130 RepID=A0AAD9Q785_ACRCE|nr:hypothetical protein P5673_022010 [Acropora cervicornis]